MRKSLKLLSILLFVACFNLSSQEVKQLTLEDAVLNQRKSLGPEKVKGMKWLNETSYMYVADINGKEVLKTYDILKKEKAAFLSIEELNQKLKKYNVELKRLPRFTVLNDHLLFKHKMRYFSYDVKGKGLEEFGNSTEGSSDFQFSEDNIII